ncbi:MAG: hypothetical protein DI594_20525 [Shewanella oneidensis]|uniref:hypothetical protein n=1 Tax=Shewanella sp. MM_2022_3 TaxID=2923280 RepID=UPI000DB55C4C|nr:hypothetical protein [Shewanella sp. MM_2022_3]MCH7424555.1 hypothetical protein [Shewanella sp. MM_2022_3]PZP27630.1 MAG: hypothetical protein DI594_20525 [Shewanella oneidensis]
MEMNKYLTWQPIPDTTGRVIIDGVEDLDDGLVLYIHISKTKKKFKIVFDPYIAYRNMDESYRTRTFSEHGGFLNSLNLVENSSWLEWLHVESQGYYRDEKIIHYSIITDADCIDVLSKFSPHVTPLN